MHRSKYGSAFWPRKTGNDLVRVRMKWGERRTTYVLVEKVWISSVCFVHSGLGTSTPLHSPPFFPALIICICITARHWPICGAPWSPLLVAVRAAVAPPSSFALYSNGWWTSWTDLNAVPTWATSAVESNESESLSFKPNSVLAYNSIFTFTLKQPFPQCNDIPMYGIQALNLCQIIWPPDAKWSLGIPHSEEYGGTFGTSNLPPGIPG